MEAGGEVDERERGKRGEKNKGRKGEMEEK